MLHDWAAMLTNSNEINYNRTRFTSSLRLTQNAYLYVNKLQYLEINISLHTYVSEVHVISSYKEARTLKLNRLIVVDGLSKIRFIQKVAKEIYTSNKRTYTIRSNSSFKFPAKSLPDGSRVPWKASSPNFC